MSLIALYLVVGSAFLVGVMIEIPAGPNEISFTQTYFASKNLVYNQVSKKFQVQETSLYWFHLSAGIPSHTAASYKLNGLKFSPVVYSTSTIFSNDCLTVDTLQWVTPAMSLSATTYHPLFNSPGLPATFVLGFRIDNLFCPLVAFEVQISTNTKLPSVESVAPIFFDTVLVNEGQGYQINNSVFVAPVEGTYFFTVTTPGMVYLEITKQHNLQICNCAQIQNRGVTVVRGSAMFTLQQNDSIQLISGAHPRLPIVSDEYGITKFQGFLYKPRSTMQVAWSVVKVQDGSSTFTGPIDYLSYNIINVNINSPWKEETNKVVIPISGTYLVDLYSYHCGWYWVGDGNTEIHVLLNNVSIIINRLTSITFENCVSRSRSTIVKTKEGDELRVMVPTGGTFHADGNRMETFSGFLLF